MSSRAYGFRLAWRAFSVAGSPLALLACSVFSALNASGCSDESAPTSTFIDAAIPPLCDDLNPCPDGQPCVAGLCTSPGDSGRLEVCTADGCEVPLSMNFGGPRLGTITEQTLTIRSVGELPVVIRDVAVLEAVSDFSVEPSGDLDTTLLPGDQLVLQVRHTAVDGTADSDRLQIISNAERSRITITVMTEYLGIPTLYAGEAPDRNDAEVVTLDFGNVQPGVLEERALYLKNRDPVIDGSVLEIREVRTEPVTSSNFEVSLDAELPAFLNQFRSICQTSTNCDEGAGDACDSVLDVCRTADGTLRDIITTRIGFIGATGGPVEESLVIVSNSGGMGSRTRTIRLLASVTFAEITVEPDPIRFSEAYAGFSEQRPISITNSGTADLTVSAIRLTDSSTFSLDLFGLSLPSVIPAGQSLLLSIAYEPSVPAVDRAELIIESDDPEVPILSVGVTGHALVAPEMQVVPDRVEFSDTHVRVGSLLPATSSVTVRNTGGSELRISSIMPVPTSTSVSVEPSSLPPIAPNGWASFAVRYSPTVPTFPTTENVIVRISSNDPALQPSLELPVTGSAIDPDVAFVPTTGPLNLNDLPNNPNRPDIFVGQQLETVISVTNLGVGPLRVLGVGLVQDVTAMALVDAPTTAVDVQPGGILPIRIRFAPPAADNYSALLTVDTNDFDEPGGRAVFSIIASVSP